MSTLSEFVELFEPDRTAVESFTKNYPSAKSTLEDICNKGISPNQVRSLIQIFQNTSLLFDLEKKYDDFDSGEYEIDDLYSGLTATFKKIDKIEGLLKKATHKSVKSISGAWKNAKKEFEHWGSEYGLKDLNEKRASLSLIATAYTQLVPLTESISRRYHHNEIDSYINFLGSIEELEPSFEKIKHKYSKMESLSSEEIHVLFRDLDKLTKKYQQLANPKNTFIRLFGKSSIFEYTERFIEIDEYKSKLENLIAARSKPKKQEIEQPVQKQEEPTPIPPTKQVCAQPEDNTYVQTEVISPSLAIQAQPLQIASKSNEEKPSPLFYHPISRNQGNRFNLPTHLLLIGYPSMRYMKLVDTLLGKTTVSHPIDRLDSFRDQLAKLPAPQTLKDLDYFYHLEYALREDMNRGTIDPLICDNPQYWERAHSALEALGQYILKSEESFGLDAAKVASHQPITGPENTYNRMLN